MECLDEEMLLEFLAGRLDGGTTAKAREHVAHCETCNAIATELIQGAAAHVPAHGLDLSPGAIVGGKYELVREIGHGGMGVVWEAKGPVAIKFLKGFDAASKQRFVRETKIAAALAYRGLPRIIEVLPDVEAGTPALVMELLDGAPLAGKRTPREARRIARDVAETLAVIHRAGLIHRDVKPANIFLTSDPERGAVLLDLGLVKSTSGTSTRLTRTGHTVGTPAYMAPEQLTGDPSIDGRADLFSLGVVLHGMLTGKRPVPGRIPSVDGLDPDTALVVAALLAMNRDARPASAEVVVDLLASIDRDG